jgi:outer membrane receptor protein involved in Fe transport
MHRAAVTAVCFILTPSAFAQTSVEITATRDNARQRETAAVTVVGRDELLRYGDQSVADALRRMPGITISGVPGRGGEIRMRGLGNGYTRVLLDGQPAPNGFSIESLSPEQIERVEIARVASAETGAQAIAGTINIILRKSAARPEREFKATVALSHDRPTTELVGQVGTQTTLGEARLNASVGVLATDARTAYATRDDTIGTDAGGVANLRRISYARQNEHRPTINLTPRLVWTLANGDTVTSQNFLRFLAYESLARPREETTLGAATAYPDNSSLFRAHTSTQRNDLKWQHGFDNGGKLDVQLGRSHFQRGAFSDFLGVAALPAAGVERVVDSTAFETTWNLTGKISLAERAGHSVLFGWDGARGERTETRIERIDAGAPDGAEVSSARLSRLALYAQDDWTVNPALSLSLGARWERFDIGADGNVLARVDRRLNAGGPLLQARLKTSKEGLLRAGITRTFKLPTLTDLSMRRYTVDNGNSALVPDRQGNPGLLPERAWGLDLAYEHYFSKEAMASISAYARRIDDVTLPRVSRTGTGWTSTTVNAGRAEAHGIEAEWKAPLAGNVVRLNGARNWSTLEAIAGPDNHLPDQAPYSAALSVERRMARLPLLLAASWNLQGGARSRFGDGTSFAGASSSDVNVSALWRVDARSSLRFSGANLLGRQREDVARYVGAQGGLMTVTGTPTWATLRIGFETKL